MRKIVIAASLAILSVPASAADMALSSETVVVKSNSLVGVWKISMPEKFRLSPFRETEWGTTTDAFCRMEEIRTELTVHCPGLHIGGGLVSRGTVTVDGNNIRLIWGKTFNRVGLTGTLRSSGSFEGTFFIEHLGISSDAPVKSTGERLSLSEGMPDKVGELALITRLFQQMAQGAPTEPFDSRAPTMRFLTPDQLRPMGAIQTIIYLGEKSLPGANSISVYDVEFANGDLICELHQRGDNTLDYFDYG